MTHATLSPSGDARVSGDADFFLCGPIGSERGHLTIHADAVLGVRVTRGCFSGSVEEFQYAVNAKHKNNQHAEVYRAALDLGLMLVKPKKT